jgi:hypothetical protein
MFEGCSGCCLSVILIPLLCVGLVACGAIYVATNAPSAPLGGSFAPSQAEAQAFDSEVLRAVDQARQGGWFSFKFTEREFSSWMALRGKTYAEDHGHVFPFEETQVGLDDGSFTFYGKLNQSRFSLPVAVKVEPRINGTGHVEFDITSVDVGGVRAPDFVLRTVSDQLQDVLIQPFDDLPGDYVLWEPTLRVQDGTFEVQGQVTP